MDSFNAAIFSVNNPAPTLDINPNSATAGGSGFT